MPAGGGEGKEKRGSWSALRKSSGDGHGRKLAMERKIKGESAQSSWANKLNMGRTALTSTRKIKGVERLLRWEMRNGTSWEKQEKNG